MLCGLACSDSRVWLWHFAGENSKADMPTALAALMSFTMSRPGSSWRVGVGDVHADQQVTAEDAAAAEEAKQKRIMLAGSMQRKSKLKPAIMMVRLASSTFWQMDDIVKRSRAQLADWESTT
jgi:hypothetical protein